MNAVKDISVSTITKTVRDLCINANCTLPGDVEDCIRQSSLSEPWPIAKKVLKNILENIDIARKDQVPLCQDTGLACVFIEIGQEVHITGGCLEDAVNEGVRLGYTEGYLRKSVVSDPLKRFNTNDNTPAVIYYRIVSGDTLSITAAPKGAGSENMSRVAMLKPSDGLDGVRAFVIEAVRSAGPNPCPPIVVGVGIGGNFDRVALLAKQALLRDFKESGRDPYYAALEEDLYRQINASGIGPQGFGGRTTALKVSIETAPTHIAMLPVAVSINCHVARHARATL